MSYQATQRYAQALFDVNTGTGSLDRIHRDLTNVYQAIEKSKAFDSFVHNPLIPPKKQMDIIKKMFQKRIHRASLKYLLFLTQRGRLNLFKKICEQFDDLYYNAKRVAHVRIFTSAPLNIDQLDMLKKHLKVKLKKSVRTQVFLRPDMIGGIKIGIGDEIYDYSIQSQLNAFRESVIKAA
jgi:F-type H+-transporting ATPase subunit delta